MASLVPAMLTFQLLPVPPKQALAVLVLQSCILDTKLANPMMGTSED